LRVLDQIAKPIKVGGRDGNRNPTCGRLARGESVGNRYRDSNVRRDPLGAVFS
jgi:hypothetical protein